MNYHEILEAIGKVDCCFLRFWFTDAVFEVVALKNSELRKIVVERHAENPNATYHAKIMMADRCLVVGK